MKDAPVSFPILVHGRLWAGKPPRPHTICLFFKQIQLRGFPCQGSETLANLAVLDVGAWRSLVAHLLGVQKVAGSNPVAPTILKIGS